MLKTFGLLLGLALIVAANFVLRCKLERTSIPPYPVFPENRVPMTWRLLLPVDMGAASDDPNYQSSYHWFTTSLTVLKLLEERFSSNKVFYFLNAALIVCSFAFSWCMLQSAVFSFTLAICMAFGTHFHWLYVCPGVEALYLFVIYLEANLLCIAKSLQTGRRWWHVGFTGSLMILALSHEQWLDYLGFLTLASFFLFVYAWRVHRSDLKTRTLLLLATAWGIGTLYLAIRLSYGEQQNRPGHESEMIFSYTSPILALEDFLSNLITYVYIAFSNYFPPFMISSNSLYYFGADQIVAQQHGYHPDQAHLTAMHHLFYWYFWAGVVFALFVFFLARNGKIAWQQGSVRHTHLFLALLMVGCGFAIHSIVKYRPYLSVPLLTYKCMTSNVGVALVLAATLMYARDWLPRWKPLYALMVVAVWCVIGYGSLARPHYLSHLSRQVGMGDLPDPWPNLRMPRPLRSAVSAPPTKLQESEDTP